MTNISKRLAILGVAFLALTASCGDTILEPGFGEGCSRGSLSVGETVTGAFSPASCRMTYFFWTEYNSPYESWSVHLEAGKAYMFHMQQIPDAEQEDANGVDAVLSLWGKDDQGRSIPLALSDDDAEGIDGYDSEFWFIAPKSGDFTLIAASYDWEDWGGYRLSLKSCPVLGTMDTVGTYEFEGQSSPCIRHSHPDNEGLLMTYTFVRMKVDSFETVSVDVDHSASYPYYEMLSPGMDTYENIWAETDYEYNSGYSSIEVTADEFGGWVTLALGTEDFDAGGKWTLTLSRSIATAPAWAPWRDGRPTMRSTFPKSEAKQQLTP